MIQAITVFRRSSSKVIRLLLIASASWKSQSGPDETDF